MKLLFVALLVLSFLNNEALAGRRKKPKVKCGDGKLILEYSAMEKQYLPIRTDQLAIKKASRNPNIDNCCYDVINL